MYTYMIVYSANCSPLKRTKR